jgi:hypothetical protein
VDGCDELRAWFGDDGEGYGEVYRGGRSPWGGCVTWEMRSLWLESDGEVLDPELVDDL